MLNVTQAKLTCFVVLSSRDRYVGKEENKQKLVSKKSLFGRLAFKMIDLLYIFLCQMDSLRAS